METVDTSARLSELRKLMKENKYDVYEHICGFSGSAGTAVITLDKAALATDGRYFNQAANQLDANWTLLKQGLEDVPTWQEWTAEQSEGGKAVGVDSTVITAPEARRLMEKIKKKGGGELVGNPASLVDQIWGSSQPSRPIEPVKAHPPKYAGRPSADKIAELRKELDKKKAAGLVVSMLDEIAWLFNLRGNDIPYNPVFFAYAIVTAESATLYVDENKLSSEVKEHLGPDVQIRPYAEIFDDAKLLAQKLESEKLSSTDGKSTEPQRKFLISTKASLALSLALGGESAVDELRSPVGDAKAIKNDTELEGMRACHVRDGAALSEYFAWLEDALINKRETVDEVAGADKLESIRRKHERFVGLSFDTISSTGANAAVIHYKPEPGNCAAIDPKKIYLCDSGAQYLDGTTDTTRTLHFGEPSDMERKAYTLVLKGAIGLELAVFPKGTNGVTLDSFARQFLWKEGLDYRHGTGHGVGSFLNVHEGPIGVGTRVQYTEVPLAPGNVVSDEPGYYEDGNFGIRIENIIMCRTLDPQPKHAFGDKPWLGFEHVTLVPLCRKLIDKSLLTGGEIDYVDTYHKEVWEKTSGFFDGKTEDGKRTLAWLERECQAV